MILLMKKECIENVPLINCRYYYYHDCHYFSDVHWPMRSDRNSGIVVPKKFLGISSHQNKSIATTTTTTISTASATFNGSSGICVGIVCHFVARRPSPSTRTQKEGRERERVRKKQQLCRTPIKLLHKLFVLSKWVYARSSRPRGLYYSMSAVLLFIIRISAFVGHGGESVGHCLAPSQIVTWWCDKNCA